MAGACDRAVVLNPKGPIADAERGLLIDAFSVMLIVVVPVIVMALLFAWRYRASNRNGAATSRPGPIRRRSTPWSGWCRR